MEELLVAVRGAARHFGTQLARTAYERGLAVTSSDGSTRPIPITATPVVLEEPELERRIRLSARLASAGFKMSRAILGGPDRELLLSALSPLERDLAERTWAESRTLVTTRVDYFAGKRLAALELNATIPAMQGYSDIAAGSFVAVVGRHLGLSEAEIAGLSAKNRSNAVALHRALLEGYRLERPGRRPERIALLCRRNDPQITEQRYLCERFRELGTEADVVHPDQLSGEDAVRAGGKAYDLVYRHLFVRRLEEPSLAGAEYVRGLLAAPGGRAVVLNPPASQVEVKTTFALLSQALVEPELARRAELSDEELEAIRAAVPWTRPFRSGPAVDPDGRRVDDLVARVAAEPDRFVLKRAWDYGGRAVFVGSTREEASFGERVRAAYGEALRWPELCQRTAADPVGGGFVVQELVPIRPEAHLLCTERAQPAPTQLYVDFSSYASVGLERQPAWNGVCRGSVSAIVNIVGGGGVLPLLSGEVARALVAAFRARSSAD